eukprot:TRINITY_DN423_c0_g2_i1.p1 TRINITY_DN423_c0_g2~~TRINITY_DN423_c0_g2_i1.p1  ORF type:complete len:554 (+),score=59.23 TRINITY_DN423_c0_g2_i1:29-1690(+)
MLYNWSAFATLQICTTIGNLVKHACKRFLAHRNLSPSFLGSCNFSDWRDMRVVILLSLIAAIEAATVATADDAPICECDDWAPKGSKYSCYDMMMWGQCSAPWMKGRCECTCGKCKEVWIGDCMCNETPPPQSPVGCQQQKAQGKCNEYWMQGYCECSCGKCGEEIHSYSAGVPMPENASAPGDDSQTVSQLLSKLSVTLNASVILDAEQEVKEPQSVTPSPATSGRKEGPSSPVKEGHVKFTILHFNDFHARVEPATEWWWPCEDWRNEKGECYGGLARMKTIVDQEREKGLPVLVLDAGDDMIGTDWNYHFWDLEPAAKMLNDIGLDAVTLGNHEFDHGPDTLADYLYRLEFPALSCNMNANGHKLGGMVQKYIIKEIQGRKVGIFGITTQYTNTAQAANPGPVWFSDASQAALDCVRELTDQKGVDIIIALTHHGFNADKYLARQIPDIDLVIGGHSHAVLTGNKPPMLASGETEVSWGPYPTWEGSWIQSGRSIPVAQVGWATRYIGRMTVEFDANGDLVGLEGEPILLDKNVQEDPELKTYVKSQKFW